MCLAAAFRADPVDASPAGTPLGPPTSVSTTGLLHFAVGAWGFTACGVAALQTTSSQADDCRGLADRGRVAQGEEGELACPIRGPSATRGRTPIRPTFPWGLER